MIATKHQRPLAFVDIETTGLGPAAQVWEVAVIRVDPPASDDGEALAEPFVLHEFVSGIDPLEADPGALALGRFFERHPDHAEGKLGLTPNGKGLLYTPKELGGIMAERPVSSWRYEFSYPDRMTENLGADVYSSPPVAQPAEVAAHVRWATAEAVIVGVNPAFDMRHLEAFLRDYGQVPSWYYTPLDLKAMAVGQLASRANVPVACRGSITDSSYSLSRKCGVEPPSPGERHTALGDADWARRWYERLVDPPDDESSVELDKVAQSVRDALENLGKPIFPAVRIPRLKGQKRGRS